MDKSVMDNTAIRLARMKYITYRDRAKAAGLLTSFKVACAMIVKSARTPSDWLEAAEMVCEEIEDARDVAVLTRCQRHEDEQRDRFA